MKILLYREGENEPFRLFTDPRRVEVNAKHMIVRTFGPKGESLEEYSLLSHKCEPIMCDNGIIEDVDRIRVSKLKNTVETPSTYNVQNAELYD